MNFKLLSETTLQKLEEIETHEDKVAFLKAAYAQCYSLAQEEDAPKLVVTGLEASGTIH